MIRTTTLNRVSAADGGGGMAAGGDGAHSSHAVQRLLEGLERLLRAAPDRAAGWMLLGLHLSRIVSPGPRPHHRRVAAALLEDAANRGNGQIFSLASGDVALLFRPADAGAAIGNTLSRLFQADMSDAAALFDVWALPGQMAGALAWIKASAIEGRAIEGRASRSGPMGVPGGRWAGRGTGDRPGGVGAFEAIIHQGELSDILFRQTAVLLRPGQRIPLVPLFREVAVSRTVLETRMVAETGTVDPFLYNHVAQQLNRRMLDTLQREASRGILLSLGQGAAGLHFDMTVAGILSDAFGAFAAACPGAASVGLRLGIEVPFADAFADPAGFVRARARLQAAGLALVLDGVAHEALALASPDALGPSLVKLTWAPAMLRAGGGLQDALAAIGAEGVVLDLVDTEAAVEWGLRHGISRFQGPFIEAMLAGERLRACTAARAAACTAAQCRERASGTAPGSRAGCRNLMLLDLGAPFQPLAGGARP